MGALAIPLMAAGTVVSAIGARNSAQANKNAYSYQAQVSAHNAQLAEWQAQDAVDRGNLAAGNQRLKTRQLASDQRTAMAANGVDITQGSPLDVLVSSATMGANDAATIRANAQREAYGYKVQASNASAQGRLYQNQADNTHPNRAFLTSILTNAPKVASQYAVGKKNGWIP